MRVHTSFDYGSRPRQHFVGSKMALKSIISIFACVQVSFFKGLIFCLPYEYTVVTLLLFQSFSKTERP